jgi:hypothetical protein
MKRRPFWWMLGVLLTAGVCTRAPAAGVKVGDDNTYAKIALLLQAWSVFTDGGAPDPDSLDTDFYLRRMRLLLFGQLNDRVNFFVETDNPNFGKQGDFSSRTFVQDAWVELDLHGALQIDVGMLLAPFSHHGMQGAVSLHSLDYHSELIRYPAGSHVVWRDFGVMARGLLWKDRIEYRLAILNGVHGGADDPRNPNDWPRLAARLTFNLFDAEGGPGTGGFFYDGLYLSKTDEGVVSTRKIVSLGVSADWQKDLNVDLDAAGGVRDRDDYFALAADLFWDLPLDSGGLLGLAGQVDFFYYDHGEEYTGYGLLSELGLRYDRVELLVCLDWFDSNGSDVGDLLFVYGGFNFWWLGHSTSIKLQAGESKKDGGDWSIAGQVQVQLLF